MALMGDLDLPYRAVSEQVASALDLIVHQARLPDGSRRIVEVAAVGAGPEGPDADHARPVGPAGARPRGRRRAGSKPGMRALARTRPRATPNAPEST